MLGRRELWMMAGEVKEDCVGCWNVTGPVPSHLQPAPAHWLPPIMLVKVGSERLSWLNTWWHWSAYRGYFQVIEWIQQPTDINALREFEVWKKKCDVKVSCSNFNFYFPAALTVSQYQGQPFCSLPNPCPLTTRELPGETLRLHTCVECPNNYPWILDPTGDGFSF